MFYDGHHTNQSAFRPDGQASPRKDNASTVKQKANCFALVPLLYVCCLTLLLLGNRVLDTFAVPGHKKMNK